MRTKSRGKVGGLGAAGGERRQAEVKVSVLQARFFSLTTCSSKPFVCPNMSCQERKSLYPLHSYYIHHYLRGEDTRKYSLYRYDFHLLTIPSIPVTILTILKSCSLNSAVYTN